MAYKRILTIQDISCVGQCSMTVAMPILSACGHETCILPTALLSTHTGGFGKPVVAQLHSVLPDIWHHWQQSGITFDAILIGYLGSVEAVACAGEILENLLAPGGICIADPAMADHGRLYSGLNETYARAMLALCRKADVILPNLTEASMLSGLPYRENMDNNYVNSILSAIGHPCVVLTGAGITSEETGVALKQGDRIVHYRHPRIDGSYHGTGDIFAAALAGARLKGIELEKSVRIAADFTYRCIEETKQNPAHWYGVKFETVLPELLQMLEQ